MSRRKRCSKEFHITCIEIKLFTEIKNDEATVDDYAEQKKFNHGKKEKRINQFDGKLCAVQPSTESQPTCSEVLAWTSQVYWSQIQAVRRLPAFAAFFFVDKTAAVHDHIKFGLCAYICVTFLP